jgi:hypothetical protein
MAAAPTLQGGRRERKPADLTPRRERVSCARRRSPARASLSPSARAHPVAGPGPPGRRQARTDR